MLRSFFTWVWGMATDPYVGKDRRKRRRLVLTLFANLAAVLALFVVMGFVCMEHRDVYTLEWTERNVLWSSTLFGAALCALRLFGTAWCSTAGYFAGVFLGEWLGARGNVFGPAETAHHNHNGVTVWFFAYLASILVGLLADYIFDRVRRKRNAAGKASEPPRS